MTVPFFGKTLRTL